MLASVRGALVRSRRAPELGGGVGGSNAQAAASSADHGARALRVRVAPPKHSLIHALSAVGHRVEGLADLSAAAGSELSELAGEHRFRNGGKVVEGGDALGRSQR